MPPQLKGFRVPVDGDEAKTRNELLAEVWRRNFPKLVGYVRSRLGRNTPDRVDFAKDIVSRAFEKIIRQSPCDSVATLSASWSTTVRRDLLNAFRHSDTLRATEESVTHEQQVDVPTPEAECLEAEMVERLRQTYDSLSALTREILRLKEWEGLSTEVIAMRLEEEGVKLSPRTIQRYAAAGLEACLRAHEAYEQGKKG